MKMLTMLTILFLASCTVADTKQAADPIVLKVVQPPTPKVIERYISLPKELTGDCRKVAKPEKSPLPFDELATYLANERDKANEECTERMRKIRAKQGQLKD